MSNRKPFGLALWFALLSLPARALDFWIEPSTFQPAAGQRVAVRLRGADGESFWASLTFGVPER